MSHQHHHHNPLHHHKEEDNGPIDYAKEAKHHKNQEHLGELGALAAGAFALVWLAFKPTYFIRVVDINLLFTLRPSICMYKLRNTKQIYISGMRLNLNWDI